MITFWNPYNVRIKVPDVTLSIKADQLPVGFSLGLTSTSIDPIIVPIGYWFQRGSWNSLQLVMNSPSGTMDLGPGETRVYSITDAGQRVPSSGGYPWSYPNTTGQTATFNLRPGYIAGYNGGSGLWLTWRDDTVAQPARGSMGFAMRKLNTGRDAIGIDINLGAALNWARSTPVRFSFGNDIWTDSAMWLFSHLYGPDDPNVPLGYTYDSVIGTSRPFGTFAFGMRLANDGSTLNSYTLNNSVANSLGFLKTDPGIVSRGTLQSSPFTGYTELGDKSAEVLVFNNADQVGTIPGVFRTPKTEWHPLLRLHAPDQRALRPLVAPAVRLER